MLAYSANGEMLWRVEDHGFVIRAGRDDTVTLPDEDGNRWVPQSIFQADIDEETGMIDANIVDFYLTIDPETRKITDKEFHR